MKTLPKMQPNAMPLWVLVALHAAVVILVSGVLL